MNKQMYHLTSEKALDQFIIALFDKPISPDFNEKTAYFNIVTNIGRLKLGGILRDEIKEYGNKVVEYLCRPETLYWIPATHPLIVDLFQHKDSFDDYDKLVAFLLRLLNEVKLMVLHYYPKAGN